ncbi:hypothetical protein C1N55_02170 [Lysinibacillus sp. SGAir0095]|nr:hypothetical protein C1N55_02170 [Lysinibacillus sp. SGAir0095]
MVIKIRRKINFLNKVIRRLMESHDILIAFFLQRSKKDAPKISFWSIPSLIFMNITSYCMND